MALLVAMALITAYAILLTLFHMKQLKDNKALKEQLNGFKHERIDLRRKLGKTKLDAEVERIGYIAIVKGLKAQLKDSDKENKRLLDINNRLMERLKKVTP